MITDSAIAAQQQMRMSQPTSSSDVALNWRAVALLVLVTLLVMGRVCFDGFTHWDDNFNISRNAAFLPPTPASIAHLWTAPTVFLYIPLTYTLWGVISWATQTTDASGHIAQAPWAFHTANLVLHLGAVLIVLRMLRLLQFNRFACFCGALLFAIHPSQVESVAWASGFRDVLAGALSLAALWQYLLFARSTVAGDARKHYFWAFATFLAAVLSKPTALTLPLCVAALDRWAAARPWRRVLPAAGAWLVVAIPFAIIARLVQQATHSPHAALLTRPLIAADALAFYLWKLIWPIHLAVDYGHTPEAILASGQCFWDWVFPASIAAALVAVRHRSPLLLVAGLIFFFGCLPVLGLAEFLFQYTSTTADHYVYFAMFGPALALAYLLTVRPTLLLRSLTLIALAAFGVLSFRQAGYWKDDMTLWPHEIAVNPRSFIAFTNLGTAYADDGDYPRAIDAFAHAAVLRPNEDTAHNDLANALHEAGRLSEAIIEKRRTAAIERDVPEWHQNWARHTAELGAFLCEAGRYDEALPYLRTAHAIAPRDPKVALLLEHATTQATTQAAPGATATQPKPEPAQPLKPDNQ